MKTISEIIELLNQSTSSLKKMREKMEYYWDPKEENPLRLHNMYARSLISAYVSKYEQLCRVIINCQNDEQFLLYALSGRSLIESVATLRYYVLYKYKPLFDKGQLTALDMKELIEIDDRHLRGGRFDWESYLLKNYRKLKNDAQDYLIEKKSKQKKQVDAINYEQINVLTCIGKWAKTTPEVLIAYNLFCDLVHPNIGSAFLVASMKDNHLYFTPSGDISVGKEIFNQSLPLLLSVIKPFGEYLIILMGTIWTENE